MKYLLEQFESIDVVLLMYIADELGQQDKSRVEQALQTDPGLQAQLNDLRGLDASLSLTMSADLSMPAPGEEQAVRNIMRELRRRELQPAARGGARRLPSYVYAAAAAAAVLLGFAWWNNHALHVAPNTGSVARIAPAAETSPNPVELASAADHLPASTANIDSSIDATSDGTLLAVDQQLNDLSAGNNDFGFPAP